MENCKYCVYKDNDGEYIKGKCVCSQLSTATICVRNDGQECPFYQKGQQNLNNKKYQPNKRMNNRIKDNWNEFKKDLINAKEKDYMESPVEDICKFALINILGYDKNNYIIENQKELHYLRKVDFAIKDSKTGKIIWLVECKNISEDINKNNWIKQVERYCLESRTNWAILTNGLNWAIYYLDTKKEPAVSHKVYEINNIIDLYNCKSDREKLYPFTKEALKKNVREKLLNKTIALCDENFYKALISKDILKNIARILHTKLGVKVELEEIKNRLKQICPNLPEDIQGFRK